MIQNNNINPNTQSSSTWWNPFTWFGGGQAPTQQTNSQQSAYYNLYNQQQSSNLFGGMNGYTNYSTPSYGTDATSSNPMFAILAKFFPFFQSYMGGSSALSCGRDYLPLQDGTITMKGDFYDNQIKGGRDPMTGELYFQVDDGECFYISVADEQAASKIQIQGLQGNDMLDMSEVEGCNKLTLSGGSGNDTIYGSQGNDMILGELGDDRLVGQAGDDTLYGGAGTNQFEGVVNGKDKTYDAKAGDTLNEKVVPTYNSFWGGGIE